MDLPVRPLRWRAIGNPSGTKRIPLRASSSHFFASGFLTFAACKSLRRLGLHGTTCLTSTMRLCVVSTSPASSDAEFRSTDP
jgi:hypothetical protein